MLRHSAHNTRVLKELFANPHVQRVAHFANGKDICSEMNFSLTNAY